MSSSKDINSILQYFQEILRPSRTIPVTPWRAPSNWAITSGEQSGKRIFLLIFGLFIFGIGDSLIIITGLGNAPWSVLAQGISINTPLSIGESTFLISIIVLSLWLPLKQIPGFGTIANIVVIAVAIEIGLTLIPDAENLLLKYIYVFSGIALVGIGSALYITCGLGTGPRDGLMTGLHYKTGVRVGRVRLGIEIVALVIGALLGGTLGIGTALFALFIGQSVAVSLGVLARYTAK